MPFGDENYANPINTLALCEHGVPRKFTCQYCLSLIELEIMKKEVTELKKQMKEAIDLFYRVLNILEKL